jgi:hypothetical protein
MRPFDDSPRRSSDEVRAELATIIGAAILRLSVHLGTEPGLSGPLG